MTNEQINEAAATNGVDYSISDIQIASGNLKFTLNFENVHADIIAKIENEVTEEYIDLLIYRSIESNRKAIHNFIKD